MNEVPGSWILVYKEALLDTETGAGDHRKCWLSGRWGMDGMTMTLPSILDYLIFSFCNFDILLGLRILWNTNPNHTFSSFITLFEELPMPSLEGKTPLRKCFSDFYWKWKKKIKVAIAKLGYLGVSVSVFSPQMALLQLAEFSGFKCGWLGQ